MGHFEVLLYLVEMSGSSSGIEDSQDSKALTVYRAIAWYDFKGEYESPELALKAGEELAIYVLDASAGWSLGGRLEINGEWSRGLIRKSTIQIRKAEV